jgi:hypothetical protein
MGIGENRRSIEMKKERKIQNLIHDLISEAYLRGIKDCIKNLQIGLDVTEDKSVIIVGSPANYDNIYDYDVEGDLTLYSKSFNFKNLFLQSEIGDWGYEKEEFEIISRSLEDASKKVKKYQTRIK